MLEFKEFPKMSRLSRNMIITEKIDGTNSSIFINSNVLEEDSSDDSIILDDGQFTIRVGSRTRWITLKNDNFGFAIWVYKNAEELLKLGEGHHFGEWWGSGIQRGYGLKEKRFSLFNTYKWNDDDLRPKCCHIIPILYEGPFNTLTIETVLYKLKELGSIASPGYMKPEGVVVWHTAANIGFKKTCEKDEVPKSIQ